MQRSMVTSKPERIKGPIIFVVADGTEQNKTECNQRNVNEGNGSFCSVRLGSVGPYRRLFSAKLQLSFPTENYKQFSKETN
uniref:Uncharacterized protein n=1 Tax=Romanomermis culicivorax TaxID=13658 RepID=A0A915IGM4_ROMCU